MFLTSFLLLSHLNFVMPQDSACKAENYPCEQISRDGEASFFDYLRYGLNGNLPKLAEGVAAQIEGSRLIVRDQSQSTDESWLVRIERKSSGHGSKPAGFVSSALNVEHTAARQNRSHQWAINCVMNNEASSYKAENVCGSFTSRKKSASPTWGTHVHVLDLTKGAAKGASLGQETKISANGSDVKSRRIFDHFVLKNYKNGEAPIYTAGLHISNAEDKVNKAGKLRKLIDANTIIIEDLIKYNNPYDFTGGRVDILDIRHNFIGGITDDFTMSYGATSDLEKNSYRIKRKTNTAKNILSFDGSDGINIKTNSADVRFTNAGEVLASGGLGFAIRQVDESSSFLPTDGTLLYLGRSNAKMRLPDSVETPVGRIYIAKNMSEYDVYIVSKSSVEGKEYDTLSGGRRVAVQYQNTGQEWIRIN